MKTKITMIVLNAIGIFLSVVLAQKAITTLRIESHNYYYDVLNSMKATAEEQKYVDTSKVVSSVISAEKNFWSLASIGCILSMLNMVYFAFALKRAGQPDDAAKPNPPGAGSAS
jgi:hypothetical protein